MEHSVEATIRAVTVYPDRARVSMSGSTSLERGPQTLVIGDLPMAMIPESVRARGEGEARVQLRSVDVRRRYFSAAPSEKAAELEEAIEETRAALAVVDDRKSTTASQLDYLDGMRGETAAFAKGLARGHTTIEEQTALLAYLAEQDGQLRGAIRELNREARELGQVLEQQMAELADLQAARHRERYEARLEITVDDGGVFTIELSYVVGKARWQPLYDIRLRDPLDDSASTTLAVSSLAEVSQQTGQDWLGVKLTLSTARPAVNQRVPELRPWFISEPRPMPRALASREMSAAAPAMAMAEAEERYVANKADVQVAETEQTGAVVTFVIPGTSDVGGDGTPYKTTVAIYDLTPQLDYLAVPRLTTVAYRRAVVTNSTSAPWLPGPVNLFNGDEFIGSNRMEYTAAGGEVELLLGAEERIEIEREMVQRDVDKRLLRDVRQIQYTYETRLKNLMATKARVTVMDNYPVSQHEQIKVKLDTAQPRPADQTDMHMLEWELTMAPQSEQKLLLQYSIEHPRDMTVAGLID